jgi:catecholate siderophore receptor
VAPSLALGIGGPDTLTLNYLHQEENDIPDYGIPFVGSRPAPVPRENYYGLVGDDRFKTKVDVGTLKFEHNFNNSVSISEAFRAGNYWFSSRMTGSHYDPGNVVPPPTDTTPLDTIMVYRDRPSVDGTVSTLMSDTQLNWKFETGPLKHTVIFGVEADREDASLIRFTNQISSGLTVAPGTIAPTSLLFPNPFEFAPHQTTVRQTPVTKTDTLAGYFEDSIDLGDHWNLVGAIRVDRFHANFVQPLGEATRFDHTDVIPSPRAALVFKPNPNASFYVSYGTSFDPSAENLSLSATNANLPPEKDQTFEAGGKIVILGGKLSLTGAIFDTEMTNARVADPDNATLQTLAGDLRVDGVELGAQGYITDRWEVVAGYTWLDGRTVKSTAPANVGKPLQNTAPNQLNIWTVYDFTDRLKVGTGINYLDSRFADQAGQVTIPAYLTWDAMVSYQLTHSLNVQLNGTNLTDAYYFANAYYTTPAENHVLPGPGRTVTLTLAYSY